MGLAATVESRIRSFGDPDMIAVRAPLEADQQVVYQSQIEKEAENGQWVAVWSADSDAFLNRFVKVVRSRRRWLNVLHSPFLGACYVLLHSRRPGLGRFEQRVCVCRLCCRC